MNLSVNEIRNYLISIFFFLNQNNKSVKKLRNKFVLAIIS
jgi:hypothetical protein